MNWRTHPLAILSRSVARRAGLLRLLARQRAPEAYEERFQRRMFAAVRPGDCVWDVGANVGHYTTEFARSVGESGHVLAFEPSPRNFRELSARVSGLANVTALNLALGARACAAAFEQGADPLGASSRVRDEADARGATVTVVRGSDLVLAGTARKPTVIKIDTEGYELEVLLGLEELLADPELRVLCVEVHFGLLAERGKAHAPRHIENSLIRARFEVSWPDASHLVAERARIAGS